MVAAGAHPAANPEGCIFCRRHDGGFQARDHPFPETLGNREIVLEPGAVCDRCNHEPLSDVDRAFLEFPAISFIRTLREIPAKAGQRPTSNWGNAVVSTPTPGNLHIETNSKKTFREVGPPLPGGWQRFNLHLQSPRTITTKDSAVLALALWKFALELLYLDHGREVFDARLDLTREMVIGERLAHGWVATSRKVVQQEPISLTYWWPPSLDRALRASAPVLLNVCGWELVTDLLVRVPIKPPPGAFDVGDLHVF